MNQQSLWDELLTELSQNLEVLTDKPEETAESTLQALWFTAVGDSKSVQTTLDLERPGLDDAQENELKKLTRLRLSGTPLAHLTGRQQFMEIELLSGPEALIPRKETEILGNTAQEIITDLSEKQKHITVMDICTGAGNLIVSLAKRNVVFHNLEDRVEIRAGNLLDPFDTLNFHNKVDLLICNPPYISSGKVPEIADEISRYEPQLAFDGGPFGVKILYSLMKEAPRFLKLDGWLAFEVGLGQGEAIIKRMKKTYTNVQHGADNNGVIRVVLGQI